MPFGEKGPYTSLGNTGKHVLWSSFNAGFEESRLFRAILKLMRPVFSGEQTVWRREVDSNSRYGFVMASKLPVFLGLRPSFNSFSLSRES